MKIEYRILTLLIAAFLTGMLLGYALGYDAGFDTAAKYNIHKLNRK